MFARINRVIRRFGIEIRSRPKSPSYPPPPPKELAALADAMEGFARTLDPGNPCADTDALRQYLSNRRIVFFRDLLRKCVDNGVMFHQKSIADFGCGTGYLLRLIGQDAADSDLSGFDTFDDMLELARRLCPQGHFSTANLHDVDGVFDIVFCTETLEHLVEPDRALQGLYERVSPGGWMILTVPNGRTDRAESGGIREDGSSYWGHIHFWSPESWRLFLEKELGRPAKLLCLECRTGENVGLIRKPGGAVR